MGDSTCTQGVCNFVKIVPGMPDLVIIVMHERLRRHVLFFSERKVIVQNLRLTIHYSWTMRYKIDQLKAKSE